jgi:hypothetical protein
VRQRRRRRRDLAAVRPGAPVHDEGLVLSGGFSMVHCSEIDSYWS